MTRLRHTLIAGMTVALLALGLGGCGLFDEAETLHAGGTISGNEVWDGGDHLVTGDIYVTGSLTIASCALVRMDNQVSITVKDGGSIRSLGTTDCPVTITSSKAAPAAGDWNRIDIYETASNNNAFAWTEFQYGGDDAYGLLWIDGGATVAVDNCTFFHIKKSAMVIERDAEIISFTGNTFDTLGGPLLTMAASVSPAIGPVTSLRNTKNYVQITDGTAEETGTWRNLGVPYHCESLYIHAAITVEAGVTLAMDPNASIDVSDGGSLRLMGAEGNRVTVTSSKAAPAAGDWTEIDIYNTASNNCRFQYADILYGGGDGTYGALWVDGGVTVELDHVTFEDNEACDVSGDGTVTATATPYQYCE